MESTEICRRKLLGSAYSSSSRPALHTGVSGHFLADIVCIAITRQRHYRLAGFRTLTRPLKQNPGLRAEILNRGV
jgi:hypothetical protein